MPKSNMEKTIETVRTVIPTNYSLTCGELNRLYKKTKDDPYGALIDAFLFGFAKGSRAGRKNRIPVL